MRARSSGSPASSAPAAPSLRISSSARRPKPRATSRSRGARSRSARPARRSTPASPTSPKTARRSACSSTCRAWTTSISRVLGRDARLGCVLDRDKARDRASKAFAALGIRAANVGVTAGGLSGGNQQKVLLSRLLAIAPEGPDPRRADARRRRRRQVRDLFDHRQSRQGRARRSSSSPPTCPRSSASATASS